MFSVVVACNPRVVPLSCVKFVLLLMTTVTILFLGEYTFPDVLTTDTVMTWSQISVYF